MTPDCSYRTCANADRDAPVAIRITNSRVAAFSTSDARATEDCSAPRSATGARRRALRPWWRRPRWRTRSGECRGLHRAVDIKLAWAFLSQGWPFGAPVMEPLKLLKAGRMDDVLGAAAGFGASFV